MKRLVIPVLGSSLLLWAVTASAAVVAPGDNPSFRVELTQVRVVAPGHGKWYSSWSFKCEFTGDNSEAESVRLEVWDDSFKNRTDWREPRRAPRWRITATREELEAMNLRVRGSQGMGLWGLDSPCGVESIKTGEKLSLEEAWLVFGDILSEQQAAAAAREQARRRAIQERLGIPQEKVERLS